MMVVIRPSLSGWVLSLEGVSWWTDGIGRWLYYPSMTEVIGTHLGEALEEIFCATLRDGDGRCDDVCAQKQYT